ncbi:penicillin-binding protein 1A [Flavobacteriaceae bacterium 14752]|uniref:penicillin-binding protein 1A n=1 Tax=Mesohalobacter salilacus TaxID=2491711 RepID=UPI000F636D81|nr:penicillin-binding protein [Flavobacteriaceae bacterium 14752]
MTAKKKKTNFNRHIKRFWVLYVLICLSVISIFLLASVGVFGKMPSFEQLENPQTNLATEIISQDGKTLGKYFKQNRTPVDYDQLPEHLVNALVATEDERYYSHSGIDAKGTLRAIAYLGSKGGASTITQQLAKQLFTDMNQTGLANRLTQKIKEWVIATRLEKQYTKDEIIAMYFNIFDFTRGAVGIRSAARVYFGKEPQDLNIEESATLVAMFKNPVLYNPYRDIFKDNALQRRNQVFVQMARNEFITEAEKDSLQALPLELNYTPEYQNDGQATYFRAELKKFMNNWIKENPKADGELYNLYSDGLKIYTTLDAKAQTYAESAVEAHMKNLQKVFFEKNKNNKTAPFRSLTQEEIDNIINRSIKNSSRYKQMKKAGVAEDSILASFDKPRKMKVFSWEGKKDTTMTPRDSIYYHKSFLNVGMMSMRPQTGAIKAWVGGIDFENFKYEHVQQAKRQVGSTFKPFVYATAIDQLHLSPCYELPNTKFTIPKGKFGLIKDWTPENPSDDYGGIKTLKQALAESINTITARVIDKTGPQPVLQLAQKLGIDTENIEPYPSIALGTPDLSVYEMVSAYSTFANKGVHVEPYYVSRIEDKNGTILYQHQPKSQDVLSRETAYVTIKLLEGVTQYGSGQRLRGTWAKNLPHYKKAVTGYPYDFENPIAGKTGTTQNQSDGWFIGMVPDLATGVWVGGEDRSVRFRSITYGQGATMALPIWGMYMKSLYQDKDFEVSAEDFEKPENLSIQVECDNEAKDDDKSTSQPDYNIDF